MTTHAYPYTSPLRDWFREEGLAQGREQGREQGRQEGREQGRQEGRQEGLAQGREEGMAQAVVQVLRARRIAVSDSDRDTILACRDDKTLTAWLDRAAVITDLRDLFAPVSDSAGPPAE